jgi:hypothetical protein
MYIQNTVSAFFKAFLFVIFFALLPGGFLWAQSAGTTEQQIIKLSKDKWQWMAEKDVDKLAQLFDAKAKFVHMSGTWKKDEELEIINTGTIWYKKADIHDVAVELFDDTAIIWSRITLESLVRGNDAKVEFTVTEVFKKAGNDWKLLALTFSSVRDTHVIKH